MENRGKKLWEIAKKRVGFKKHPASYIEDVFNESIKTVNVSAFILIKEHIILCLPLFNLNS